MPSKLFQLAQQIGRTALGRGRSARSRANDQRTRAAISNVASALSQSPSQISAATGQLLDSLGQIGSVIRQAIGAKSRSLSPRQAQEAAQVLGITKTRGRPSELPLTEEVGRQLEEIARPKKPPPLPRGPLPQPAGGKRPPPLPPRVGGGQDDDEPDEHGIELSGRGTLGYDPAGTAKLVAREILTPGSSNVYSFVFEQENVASGILYVTFKAWSPGQKGKRNSPGPTYAYYDVPVRKYKAFASMAGSTAGGAVWEFLRVRGSKWDHRHPYRLVAGSLIPAGGEYVPRKATRRGFVKRSLPKMGTGRRSFVSSTLPEARYDASPNRARPNRGRP